MAFTAATDTYARGFAGSRNPHPADVVPAPAKRNAEASAEIPFGTVVKHGTLIGDALQLTSTADRLAGVAIHRYNYVPGIEVNATTGDLLPNADFDVLEYAGSGIMVTVDEAVTEASPVRVRVTAAGGGRGTFRTGAVAAATILLTGARFAGRTTGAGPVLVRGNFVVGTAD